MITLHENDENNYHEMLSINMNTVHGMIRIRFITRIRIGMIIMHEKSEGKEDYHT